MTRHSRPTRTRFSPCIVAVLSLLAVTPGCGSLDVEDDYLVEDPARKDENVYESELKARGPQTIWGNDGFDLFNPGGTKKRDTGGGGIGVNSYLWRASLDTIAFMPLASADPFGGVIITDWFVPPEVPDERYKMSVYIMGRELRADGIRVAVFRQQIRQPQGWINAKVAPETATNLENEILTRARQLRLASAGK